MSFVHNEYKSGFQHDFPYQDPSEADAVFGEQKKRYRGCLLGCGLGCLGIIVLSVIASVVFYFYCLKGRPLEVSAETTIITEPKKKDGKSVDFFRAVNELAAPKVPDGENGFKDILAGYGKAVFDTVENAPMWHYPAMCKVFNIDSFGIPPYVLTEAESDTPEQWLTVIGPGLDAAVAASMKPAYFIPLIRQNENDIILASQPISVYQFHGELTKALRFRAAHRFSKGDYAGGWKDYLATLRLFRTVTVNSVLYSGLKRNDEGNALLLNPEDFREVIAKMPPELRSQAVKDIESLPRWQDRKTTLKALQFSVLDIISATDDIPKLLDKFSSQPIPADARAFADIIGFDWNLVAVRLNMEFEAFERELTAAGDDEAKLTAVLNRRFQSNLDMGDMVKACFVDVSFDDVTVAGRSETAGQVAGFIAAHFAGQMFSLQLEEEKRCQTLKEELGK
ncbi:hypothetical protein FACS189419_09280 [Planctomycetales bacterium]|nr:hypothetical protein FACS189419_09280 [Planctomycetales bacterium]